MAVSEQSYDVVIIGGGIYGASIAWWLTRMPGFQGSVLVLERDLSYAQAATSLTNSCIRQQFTNETNIRISQFGAEFVNNFKLFMDDAEAPDLKIQSFGYLYLADTEAFAGSLRNAQKTQEKFGAATRFLSRNDIAAAYPFYNLDDIIGGNHNLVNEGYFDGGTIFDWFRRNSRKAGVTFREAEVVDIDHKSGKATHVRLDDGARIACGTLVNAAGTRARNITQMVGLDIPVEPRKRYTFVFDAAHPLECDLPLTIDPSGVHMRTDGRYYMAGSAPDTDDPVDPNDFSADHDIWVDKVWPIIATRIPQFEAIKLANTWVGHYDYNTHDQNAIVGPHPEIDNLLIVNGFSGHGLQQAPAIGRGIAEWITHGAYQTLDLTPFNVTRVLRGEKFVEKAVI